MRTPALTRPMSRRTIYDRALRQASALLGVCAHDGQADHGRQLLDGLLTALHDLGINPTPMSLGDVAAPPKGNLTARQMQILVGMSQGKSNAEIGRELSVSEDTVKTHARHLFRNIGARDRAHAVAQAFRTGLIS
ncbi:DNA-binding NarL/FixJ family response regulator [Phytomonospora endophytica]|uniref:DNA-binding NarL/FixJ family response regulator n=1 Tax=Phytomonospora endophytica TaxID=714109 RepID=A0A841FU41_9ACTN|nr:DNA-binding NarL/FixJ family response regulator [Phytomonospora endophytica]